MNGVYTDPKALAAGFSPDEIAAGQQGQRQRALAAGFGEDEIDGVNTKPTQDAIMENFKKAALDATQKSIGIADGLQLQRNAEAQKPQTVSGFVDALKLGLDTSVGIPKMLTPDGIWRSGYGMLGNQAAPAKELDPNAPWYSRTAMSIAQTIGDLPYMIAGGAAGGAAGLPTGPGAVAAAGAGAFALPQWMRATLMDHYKNGAFANFGDYWSRMAGNIWEGTKGAITGASAAGGGALTKAALPAAGNAIVRALAPTAVEVEAMTTVGAALDGHAPTLQEFQDAAITIAGLKAATHAVSVAPKLMDVYRETAKRPVDVISDMERDPTIAQDLLSKNIATPRAYEQPAVGPEVAPTQRQQDEAALRAKIQARYTAQNNGSGESAASLEALSRVQDEAAKDQARIRVKADGTLEPVMAGVDAVDTQAGKGEVIFQKNVGKETWTAVSSDPSFTTEALANKRAVMENKLAETPTAGAPAEPNVMTVDELGGGKKPPPEETRPPESPEPTDAQAKVLSRVVGGDKASTPFTFSRLYTQLVDRLNPIKQAEKAANAGERLSTGESPYDLERLTAGTMSKVSQFIKRGTFDFDTYETTGKSYQDILKPVENDLDGFRAYMVAKRAVELHGRGVETGVDPEAAATVVRDGAAKYEGVFQDRLKYRGALLDYLEQSGILNKDTRAAMETANKDYVPFYRFIDDQARANSAKTVRNPIREIKGSERQIIDPIESDVKDTALFLALAEKNASRQAMVNLGPEVAKPLPRKVAPVTVQQDEVARFLKEHGLDESEAESFPIFRAMREQPSDNEITVFKDGKPTQYEVDPDVATAFNGTDKITSNFLMRMIGSPAALLRAGTTLSPDFMPRNLMRDAVSAFIYAGSHPIKTASGGMSLIAKDEAFDRWQRAGGPNATIVAMDRDYINRHLYDLNTETGLMQRGWNVLSTPIDWLRATSEFFENATRLGVAKSDLEVAQDKAAMQAAAMLSRDATTDFAKRGSNEAMQQYTRLTAFMNPGIQGVDRMFQAFAENPVGTTAKTLAAVTIPSLLLWWKNHDDPRYQEIPQWERDLFWIVMTKDTIFRVPKPFELGVLFGTVPERMLDAFVAEQPDAFKNFDQTMYSAFGINYIPTAISPIIEQDANRSLFTGHPIVSREAEKLLPEYQYNVYTTELAKSLGSIIGSFPGMKRLSVEDDNGIPGAMARALTSPALIENYVRAWTGGMGTYALKASDAALRKTGVLPDPPKPEDTLADIPFVKAFVVRYPDANSAPIQNFYDEYTAHQKVFASIMQQLKEGNANVVAKELKFDPLAMVQLDGIKQAMGEQSQLVRNIYKSKDMSPSDKRQLIDTLYFRMQELAETGNKTLAEVKKGMKQ